MEPLDVSAYLDAARRSVADAPRIDAAACDFGPPALPSEPVYSTEEWEALADFARVTSPDRKRWGEYPTPMRAAWRERMGVRWRTQLALPVAPLPGDPAPDAPADAPAASAGNPPERDTRPPDVPPPPTLPSAPALATVRTRKRQPQRSGFLDALGAR